MGGHDPFSGDLNKTIIRPTPGGQRRQRSMGEATSFTPTGHSEIIFEASSAPNNNPITTNILTLLVIVPQLRNMAFHNAIGELQERLAGEIKGFQSRSLKQGATEQQVRIASYFICSMIDEAVLNTPWGKQSNWGHDSLLVSFHREAWGGENFFLILDRLMQRPAQNLDLLEVAYLCLSMGFEGKYRLGQEGLRELEKLRLEVYLELKRARGDPEYTLSVNWQGLRDLRSPFARSVPLWVMGVVSCLLLLVVYLGFSYALNGTSNRLFTQWMAIAGEEAKTVAEPQITLSPPPVQAANKLPWWRELLAKEISQKMVEVLDGPILRLTAAFQSGSDQIRDEYMPMLNKIAQEVKSSSIRIEVRGHTDNKPIFSARFPSNWDLSNARAKRVASVLDPSHSLEDRITYKGRADSEPVVPNDTPDHRAMNRRIDLHIR